MSRRSFSGRLPTRSERTERSTLTICETFATESFGSPARAAASTTFPGAAGAAGVQPQPVAHAAATCDDHPNQASAQRAKGTRDAGGDGIYCVIYSAVSASARGPRNALGSGWRLRS